MLKHVRFAVLVAAASIAAPLAAEAQQMRTIDVPPTKRWQHAATGLVVPQSLIGLTRTTITDSTADESDIFLQFVDPAKTALSVYLFRPALADLPVWFDRVETQILERRDVYGEARPNGETLAFPPPGGTTALSRRQCAGCRS